MDLDFLGVISASCVDKRMGVYSNHVLVTSLIPIGVAALIIITYWLRLACIGLGTAERAAARASATQQHVSGLLFLSCESTATRAKGDEACRACARRAHVPT